MTPPPHPAPSSASDPQEIYSIPEMVNRVCNAAVEKAHHPLAYFIRSLVGGSMVAFGVLLSVTVSVGVPIPGLSSLLMGVMFGFSLVIILVSGMALITADMSAGFLALLRGRMTVGRYVVFLVVGLIGNVLGTLVFVFVCALAGGPYLGGFLKRAIEVGTAKSGAPDVSAFLLAMICTWLLQTAMFLFFKARTDMGRITMAFYGPLAFVVANTQHVIANVGFIGLPLLLTTLHPEAGQSMITWGMGDHGLLRNLLITTVGNLVGGTIFVALPFHLIARAQSAGRSPAAAPPPAELSDDASGPAPAPAPVG